MKRSALNSLRQRAQDCRACPLYKKATQAVMGDGDEESKLFLVGEQPGDKEDQQGLPFVGSAGQRLRRALEQAGIPLNHVYLTNAVKHFKWTATRGKRRLHAKPNREEINACYPWLIEELKLVKPVLVVALGGSAGYAVLGRVPSIGRERQKVLIGKPEIPPVLVSWHPSAILRVKDPGERAAKMEELISDLRLAYRLLREGIEKYPNQK